MILSRYGILHTTQRVVLLTGAVDIIVITIAFHQLLHLYVLGLIMHAQNLKIRHQLITC